ncbi:hypothetical protein J3R83DRAFT_3596 [Lanmaoa asiatica]|nr:hypothetical protein J3R83DRAFT_3596 [Lanmaoa asiatica]
MLKRQKRSFTPTSDDGDLVVPAAHDAETPTPENAPLIRQPVGFSWTPSINANVSTYQVAVASQPVVPYFLPGQAPPSPPKPKSSKPRAPRKKKGQLYSDQTSKFKLSGSNLSSSPASGSASLAPTSAGNSAGTGPSSGATRSSALSCSMIPAASYANGYADGNATAGPSNTNGATISVASAAPLLGTKRPRKSSKRKVSASVDDSFNHPSARPSAGRSAPLGNPAPPQYPLNNNPRGRSVERTGQAPDLQRTYSAPPCAASGGTPVGPTNASTSAIQGPAQNVPRPMRMVTLLIEDLRSGVPDLQLAEVRVPLRVAEDPEGGFWADAVEICNALQGGPSRVDGPAKVYTMRGRFRQFFMRVDQFDQLQVQSAHLSVSKERTLSVFVEAPVPQGHLPRPPAPPTDVRPVYNSGSEREVMSSPTTTHCRPMYSLVTREDQIERLSKSNYVRAPRRRASPVSESGSYGHSQRTTSPNARHRLSRHDSYAGPSRRPLTPPIPGRLADTQEEKDEAIANYIRSHIENHPGWIEYMQSKAKPQRVSEVLNQYAFVEDRVRELIGRKTPVHWDGAPNSYVEKLSADGVPQQHIWRVLKLDTKWGEECQETLTLVTFYGRNGSRYEDSRVTDMINDTSPPRVNTMDKFLRFLRGVDENFTQDTLSGHFVPMSTQG